MSRAGEGGRLKKHNCCLTCSIVCFIILIVFFAALYFGGSILFKTYVSPHIGGLTLNDAIGLAANVLSGKETKPDYTEEDLDSFYSGLSEAMFLSEKTEDELEYELVSDEKRATLAPEVAAAEEDGSGSASYDEDAAYAAFLLLSKADRYALLSAALKEKITLAEYSALAGDADAAVASRKKVGLKPYRLSVEQLLGDANFGAEDFSMESTLEKSLSSLDFNFDTLENYDIDNAAAQTNEKFTTFSVNGKQVSSFINDVLSYFLSSENSPLTSALKDSIPVDVDLKQYIRIASVTILNTPLATKGDEALYDQKDTALSMSISLDLRDLVKAALATDALQEQLSGVPSFALNLIPKLVPKHFSAHATVYPLAPAEDKREVVLMVNKKSEKNAKRLSTLLNALLGKEGEDASGTFLGGINDKVVSTFSSVNETVKINFIASKDKEGNPLKDSAGNTYSEMKIMTWETVLSLIDKEGRLSAHDVFTMLKCLYISKNRPSELSLDASMTAFKSDMSAKYGVSSTYLDEHNILSTDDLGGMIENIDLKTVDFTKENDAMRVRLSAEALASFMKKMLSEEKTEEVAAAEEEDSSSASLLKGLDPKVCGIEIKKVSEKDGVKIFSFELVFAADLAEMLQEQIPDDGIAGELTRKILPKQSSYFGIMLYLSEYMDGDKVVHKVGKNIDSPAEGVASAYASKIRINDFTYAETSRVFDAINTFMEVLSGSSFEISSITGNIEDTISDVFDSIAKNDFNLAMRLYESDETNRGGLTLPSLYELVESLVKPKLTGEETFTTADAKDVLYQMYTKEVSMEKTFEAGEEQAFLDEINDKFYIVKDSALTTDDLFGDGASNLSTKIKVDSIYFKPTAAEAAKWTGEKKSLYTDTRSSDTLRATLSGKEVAALVGDSNLIPQDMIASFGSIDVIGAAFKTTAGKTYITFDMKLLFNKEAKEGEGDAVKYGNIFPDSIKLSAKILLYAPSYTEAEPRYHSTIVLNEESSSKVFLLMRTLGGEDLSEKTISDKIAESVASTFNTLEGKIPLYFQTAGGEAFTEGDEEIIKIADVFTFLIKETTMTDLSGDATDPDDLAARLRGFGKQETGDVENAGVYTWMGDKLKTFLDTDDDYIYDNMQRAYFLNDKPDMDTIYTDFNSKFDTIKDDFNLNTDENGLFYYDGDILNLKVSDRALAVIIKEKEQKENNSFAGAVAGEGMTVEIVSLKLYHEDTKLVIESAVKIIFDGRDSYKMMPDYFFVIAKTIEDDVDPSGFVTTISMNLLSTGDSNEMFQNIQALSSKGMNASSFNKADIENTINTTISSSIKKFPESVTFGEFTSSDITNQYNTTAYGENIRVAAGDGYISFPSVYSYLIDMFYKTEEEKSHKPTDEEMQHMILALHSSDNNPAAGKTDTALRSALITNAKDSSSYYKLGFTGTTLPDDSIAVFTDKYLAHQINDRFTGVVINGNLDLTDALQQMIVLRGLGALEEKGAREEWEEKFSFASGTGYTIADNVLIATAILDLSAYNTGTQTDLLPENLWFTVFADLTNTDDSEGLLYNMNAKDMEIFEHIVSKYNTFVIKNIAKQFAHEIDEKIAAYTTGIVPGSTINYKRSDLADIADWDDFVYYGTIIDAAVPQNEIHAKDHVDGVGYVVLAMSAV